MRVLLDECLPRRLAPLIAGHDVTTVPETGMTGLSNGALLSRVDGDFDAFITIDKNLPAQNAITRFSFGVVVLRAASNRLDTLKPLIPQILAALETLKPGQVVFTGSAIG